MYDELIRDTREDRKRDDDPHRAPRPGNHLMLWASVFGSMAVIIGLWVMLLPSQLSRPQDTEPSQWSSARVGQTEDGPGLIEAIRMHGKSLEDLERKFRANARSAAQINELRAKIEAASKKETATRPAEPAPTNDANANVNAQ